jgi:DegV family protein with EDD domain
MSNIAILLDSTCDLGLDLMEKYDLDYVMMNYVVDGKEYPASLGWEDHPIKEFYDLMRDGKRILTTQVPRERFEEKFSYYLEKCMDVVYISCSSALSGSVKLAQIVADELAKKYTDNKVYCIDALICSLGQSYLAMRASELRAEGKNTEEIVNWVVENRLKENQFGTVGSLEFLKKAGRVTASSAFFGNLLGIKPILISDKIGQNYAIKKVKGARNAFKEMAQMMADAVENPEEQTLYISHSDSEKEANVLKDEILALVPFKDVYMNCIGPIVGASIGPGAAIAYCFGKEVTIEGKA